MASIRIFVCDQCGHAMHPARENCPRCRGRQFSVEEVSEGRVEHCTTRVVRVQGEEIHLAEVRTSPAEVMVTARAQECFQRGDRVQFQVPDARLWALRAI